MDVENARRQLELVLASPGFLGNERMSRFLRFLVERNLEGSDNQLKESVIAVEVFGRKPDHDPSRDSIVRTEAGRLRARLAEYYLTEGKDDRIVIELPKGGYTPALRWLAPASQPAPPEKKNRRRVLGSAGSAGDCIGSRGSRVGSGNGAFLAKPHCRRAASNRDRFRWNGAGGGRITRREIRSFFVATGWSHRCVGHTARLRPVP